MLVALLAPIASAAGMEEAAQLASGFAEAVVRETYGAKGITMAVRTEYYAPSDEPERFWVTVRSPDACGHVDEPIGEIYLQFVRGQLYRFQWLPAREPATPKPETTRARVLEWARGTFHLDKQLSQRFVPSVTPTEHLEFTVRREPGTITLIIDRKHGFLHSLDITRE